MQNIQSNPKDANRYIVFALYLVIIILINIFSINFPLKLDLTANKVFTLSQATKDALAELTEPLTVKGFFSQNLEPPQNTVEQGVRDILDEFTAYAPDLLNYEIYKMGSSEDTDDETIKKNIDLANSYNIYEFGLKTSAEDETKVQNAYMGLTFIYGDMIETISPLTSADKLEYQITTLVQKLNAKISAFQNLDQKINVKLFYTKALHNLPQLQQQFGHGQQIEPAVANAVSDLNKRYFNKFELEVLDPNDSQEALDQMQAYNLPSFGDDNFKEIFCAGLVVQYKDAFLTFAMLENSLFGVSLIDPANADFVSAFENAAENIIGVNQDLGILTSNGTTPLYNSNSFFQQGAPSLNNFNQMLSQVYQIKQVDLEKGEIPTGLSTLLIIGPTQPFSDYELLMLDQFLMQGGSLGIFLDAYQQNQQAMFGNQPGTPLFMPLDTGLEKFLNHYGLNVKKSFVLDTNCPQQVTQNQNGSYAQHNYYEFPFISQKSINRDFPIMSPLKEFIVIFSSPVELDQEKLTNAQAYLLYSSNDTSWEMPGENYNGYFTPTPADDPKLETKSQPLAYILEGSFTSYFKDTAQIPVKPAEEKPPGTEEEAAPEKQESPLTGQQPIIKESQRPGKIFLTGTSKITTDDVFYPTILSSNTTLVMNIIDYLNNKTENAILRGKGQLYNPLNRDIEDGAKIFVRWFNIVGLPVIIILLGLFIWLQRKNQSRLIESRFKNGGKK